MGGKEHQHSLEAGVNGRNPEFEVRGLVQVLSLATIYCGTLDDSVRLPPMSIFLTLDMNIYTIYLPYGVVVML